MMTTKTMNKIERKLFVFTNLCCALMLIMGIWSVFGLVPLIAVIITGGIALTLNTIWYLFEELKIFLVDDKKK